MKIGILIDFTHVSKVALAHASLLPPEWLKGVSLIHIAELGKKVEAREKLKTLLTNSSIPLLDAELCIIEGDFFQHISDYLHQLNLNLVIVGTHGIKSIADPEYGINILRLIKSVSTPLFIVQDHSEIPEKGLKRILLPKFTSEKGRAEHTFLSKLINTSVLSLLILNFAVSEHEIASLSESLEKNMGIDRSRILYDYEPGATAKEALAKSILQYVSIEDVDMIAIEAKDETAYLHQNSLQELVLNRHGYSVLYLV